MKPNYRLLRLTGAKPARGILRRGRRVAGEPAGGGRQGARPPFRHRKAKSVIQIWMWGDRLISIPSTQAEGGELLRSLNSPIETNVKGIRICELLPLLAKQADKYSLIRSMTHGLYAHETASYTVQTGRIAGGHDVYPSVGA